MNRLLGSGDDSPSILLDENGDEYDSYSLAWRYLGMYIDCNIFGYDGFSRKLNSGDGNCDRIVLWALYHDPGYRGGQIGEYQFYDQKTESWDRSTCKTIRCARLDCHETRSRFKLLGVYKESDGMVDWAEQLFKHQGYCIWNENTYEYMQESYETWPQDCTQLYYTYDQYGNSVYFHMKPEAGGNMTLALYSDNTCSQISTYTVDQYLSSYYSYYSNYRNTLSSYETRMSYVNEYLNVYKICQPCRAYNLNKDDDDDDAGDGSGSGSGDKRHRELDGNNEDGEGDEEKWGYNCYDDAGYTNCHQCYKFQAKTDMEEASADDLLTASEQGTILEIKVNGVTYGRGSFTSPPELVTPINILVLTIVIAIVIFVARRYQKNRSRIGKVGIFKTKDPLPPSFEPSFKNDASIAQSGFLATEKSTPTFQENILYPSLMKVSKVGSSNNSTVELISVNVEMKQQHSSNHWIGEKDTKQNEYQVPPPNHGEVQQENNNEVVDINPFGPARAPTYSYKDLSSLRLGFNFLKTKEIHEMISAAFAYVRLGLFRDATQGEEQHVKNYADDNSTVTSDYTRYRRDYIEDASRKENANDVSRK